MPPPRIGEAARVGSGGGVGLGLKIRLLPFFLRLGLTLCAAFVVSFRSRMRLRPLSKRAGEMLRLAGKLRLSGGSAQVGGML
mmetsp:Transcript_10087/g.28514  ORF Transcript_10087/g.28514 Transcript_10087/m.28514 type:complete len:82 (-) Transcript_10087:661-906(-)